MEKKMSWLDSFVESRKAKIDSKKNANVKTVKASVKKTTVASIEKADIAIIDKAMLPKAVEGNTVKYKNFKWKVVDASYKDNTKKGLGVVMEKIAGIDTKKVTDPAERAMTDPGDVYDYNVRETSEIPDFQQAEAETYQEIAKEDAVDHCTTPDARYQNPVLMDSATEVVAPEAPAVEETIEVDEETPVVVEDEAVEDAPVVEETETETPADEVAEDEVEEADEVAEDEAPEEDTFTFEDVDEAPLDEETDEADEIDESKEAKEDKKEASVKHVNRIIAAMLADK